MKGALVGKTFYLCSVIRLHMKMAHYSPSPLLAPFVKTFLVIESQEGIENNTLPDTSVVMSFRIRGTVSLRQESLLTPLSETGISGLRKSARLLRYAPGTTMLLVIFQEGGAAAFFKTPLHELFDTHLPLDDLVQLRKLEMVEEQLSEAAQPSQWIAIVEQFLQRELVRQPDLLIQHAVTQIKAADGHIKMKSLAASLFISQDAFEKRFRRIIGTSPKQFAAIVRLRHLLAHYTPHTSLTAAAYSAGYFDQAHFIKDFKGFTGQSPQAFFQSADWW